MKLNRFIINSDYTAEKQKGEYILNLTVSNLSIGANNETIRSTSIPIPSGVWFESVLMSSSLVGNDKYVGPALHWESSDQMLDVHIEVYNYGQQYTLRASIKNWDEVARTISFTAQAKIKLSVAPSF
jgi:hypothetical protein